MNLPLSWPDWIQPLVSVAGVVALGAWMLKFVSHFTAKSKELRELDSQVNTTLREALSDQKQARADERAELQARLLRFDQQVRDAEERLKSTSAEFRRADRMATVALFGIQLLATVLKGKPRERQDRVSQDLVRAMTAIRDLAINGLPRDGTATDPHARYQSAANPVLLIFEAYLHADIGLEERTRLVRALLEDARDNPDMPMPQLFERLHTRIVEGEESAKAVAAALSVEAARKQLLDGA